MTVLNLRDEPVQKDAPREARPLPAASPALYEEVNGELSKLASATPFVRHLYLADSAGRLFGMAHASRAVDDPPVDLRPAMQGITCANWNGELKRVFLESENGITALLRIAQNRWLIALCERGTSLGTVSIGVGKFFARTTPPRVNGTSAAAGAASEA